MSPLITLNELSEGIEKVVENASRYLSDALFLFKMRGTNHLFFFPCYLTKSQEKLCYWCIIRSRKKR